jgi:glyoxylase-like metal-dependent hydrolase (beta-lactamase superfamily II)
MSLQVNCATMTQWHRTTALLLLVFTACAPKPRAAGLMSGGLIYRFQIGALEAVALNDGDIYIDNDGEMLALGASPAEVTQLLAASNEPPTPVHVRIEPLLVKDGDRLMLFDVGVEDVDWAVSGHLFESLALAGYTPTDITDIFISHAHLDHVGELATADGKLTFPNAAIYMSAPEWVVMDSEDWSCIDMNPRAKRLPGVIRPKIVTFEPGAQITPSVRAVAALGHSPGHTAFEITSKGERIMVVADLVHSYVLSLQRPQLPVIFDTDQEAAVAARLSALKELAASGERIYAFHFPFPGVGRIIAQGDVYAWVAEH